jgi:exopolysaccharide biosynthesis polyprenyl glycosylphosphotransferase
VRPGSPEQRARLTLFVLGDAAIAWGCLALTVFIRRNIDFSWTQSVLPPEKFPLDRYNVPLFIVALILSLALNGFYNLRVSRRQRPILAAALLMQLALAAVGGVVLQRAYPRTILFAVPFLEAVAIPAWRRVARLIVPVRARDTVILAEPEDAQEFLESVERSGDARINVVGVVSHQKPQCGSVEYWGPIENPDVRTRIAAAEEAVYVAHDADPSLRLKLLALRGAPGFLMVPSQADTLLTSATFGWMGDQPLVEIAARGDYGVGGFLKRTFDILLASLLLILTLPLALLISLVILIDSGLPILIRQQRAGKDGEPFDMWKFRTMFNDHATADLLDLARENDARVTRSGVWLRRHRLDELPQLLNVLTGDMSLVGPRPERPEIMQLLATKVPNFDLRLMVRPGLAGLAQVSAEYDTQPAVKLRYDLTYICAWSLALDVRILLRAVSTALSGRGL